MNSDVTDNFGHFLPLHLAHCLHFSECGKFLALDLGGTNFRVLLIELGPHIFHMVNYKLPIIFQTL